MAKSKVLKRSVVVGLHKTSVSIEEPFWLRLGEIAAERGLTMSKLVSLIDADRRTPNLSSELRLFVLDWQHRRILALEARQPLAAPIVAEILEARA